MVRLYWYVKKQIARIRQDESGATMIEYSVLVGLITIALIATVLLVGGQIQGVWNALTAALATIPAA